MSDTPRAWFSPRCGSCFISGTEKHLIIIHLCKLDEPNTVASTMTQWINQTFRLCFKSTESPMDPWVIWGVKNPDEAESLRLKHLLMDQIQQEQTTTEIALWRPNTWWGSDIDQCYSTGGLWSKNVQKPVENPWKLNFNVQFKGLDHWKWKGWQDNSSVLVPSRLGTF